VLGGIDGSNHSSMVAVLHRSDPEEVVMPTSMHEMSLAAGNVALRVSALSDVGTTRKLNEDSHRSIAPVFLVADGMGGHAHGDWASQRVVETIAARIPEGRPTSASAVLEAITEANSTVRQIPSDYTDDSTMAGTTVSGIALVESEKRDSLHWMIFNVGDSRVYSWDGGLNLLTVDHSAVQELIDRGDITEAEAAVHSERNVITRAIGVDREVEPDVWLLPAGGQQTFLICTDGLTKGVSDEQLSAVFTKCIEENATDLLVSALVSAAIESGGLDNITVVVVESSIVKEGETAAGVSSQDSLPAFLEETRPRL